MKTAQTATTAHTRNGRSFDDDRQWSGTVGKFDVKWMGRILRWAGHNNAYSENSPNHSVSFRIMCGVIGVVRMLTMMMTQRLLLVCRSSGRLMKIQLSSSCGGCALAQHPVGELVVWWTMRAVSEFAQKAIFKRKLYYSWEFKLQ